MSQLLDSVTSELAKLPGVGRRTALRLALHILRSDLQDADLLSRSISDFRTKVKNCAQCNNISDNHLCPICSSNSRNTSIICVVENVGDLISIEQSGQYNGLYHVLGGVISPLDGIAPSDLKIDLLELNIQQNKANEVILALPTSVEGETTMFYISRKIQKYSATISAISRGIGFGDDIEYADSLTISHALRNRQAF